MKLHIKGDILKLINILSKKKNVTEEELIYLAVISYFSKIE
ncbi:hypothetical protein GNP81_07255 [Aliivibrio fischeri]|uniref:Uncharacterized protein n=2 Tax=Aliivibrio fischeri TaxID=668 RepID=B1WN14_ALIF1|nr:hypothetical protein [Aliivibrio fischeri]ACB55646.1 hypothetical protein VF_2606 [Aliivibrio fischeri ES114]MUJ28693.1 hypothetical protein [Aliivibrio fischeri]MUK38867.1 hypothetical protein [Aliivibrio fischeri]MUK44488.1 hypothetical protein [Aliivibrio fischeri]MUK60864.1 hypothetical protein [Aliivibrio fischeri]